MTLITFKTTARFTVDTQEAVQYEATIMLRTAHLTRGCKSTQNVNRASLFDSEMLSSSDAYTSRDTRYCEVT